jgi:two-component system cell cycle sensor histidine kinase/response regulator CckA
MNPPLPGSDRLIVAGVLAAALLSAGLLLLMLDQPLLAGVFLATLLAAAGIVWLLLRARPDTAAEQGEPDWVLTQAAIESRAEGIAITDRDGRLVCANRLFGQWFPGYPAPPGLALVKEADIAALGDAMRTAWRDGSARLPQIETDNGAFAVEVSRIGLGDDHLIWRLSPPRVIDSLAYMRDRIGGEMGSRLAGAGIMTVVVDGGGMLVSANRVFLQRALGRPDADVAGRAFVDLLLTGEDGIRLVAEGPAAGVLRLIQVPLEDQAEAPSVFLLIDEEGGPARGSSAANIQALLSMLPLGLALAERDGRLLFMNEAFARAAHLPPGKTALYPSDLVVKEDKAAVSDAVRRFAAGHRLSGDLAVRLVHRPDEAVALTIAGARGLGDAAVLLSLKDNSEETRLQRQVAQATKMQAVGQLAGGVAHDFNNILTAIIGHCDLMLMRHSPGDSDYDDIQQIRQNSNRAASLTRQLLAFSRQQTLRPQILQLPDVISDISNLVKRLLGETVTLVVKHGRNLGAVRADPGQLEQVIVNLAVNARDAIETKGEGGGTLTLQTYAVSAAEVRQIGSDILPVGDYTALSVSDTGTGIPPDILGKIFEPFFTTKEVGKGTGLGLSTVYGIVKQSGGFIFADSKPGKGTSFVIYLPVHRAEQQADARPRAKPKQGELWGSGAILLVEDEDMVRAVAERALSRQGYKVTVAANGEEALELLEGGLEIDLLISDVVMPTMDGPTLVRHARAKYPKLPILFMSGYAEEQLRQSIDIDHVAFLPKPFSVQQLAEAARDTLTTKVR